MLLVGAVAFGGVSVGGIVVCNFLQGRLLCFYRFGVDNLMDFLPQNLLLALMVLLFGSVGGGGILVSGGGILVDSIDDGGILVCGIGGGAVYVGRVGGGVLVVVGFFIGEKLL